MGDWFQVIVDRDASPEEAPSLALAVRDWLTAEGIVQGTADAGCVLAGVGYPPGPACGKAVVAPLDHAWLSLTTNGLAIVTGRTVCDAGQGGFTLVCRSCRASSGGGERWSEAVEEWYKGTGPGMLACLRCGHAERVAEWVDDPPWGFGSLGLQFWNWPPLRKSFVAEVSRRLGHRTVLVAGKL